MYEKASREFGLDISLFDSYPNYFIDIFYMQITFRYSLL